jgi:hypothetical protein
LQAAVVGQNQIPEAVPQTTEQQSIQDIQSNPNLPPQAKAAAIAARCNKVKPVVRLLPAERSRKALLPNPSKSG